MSTSGHSCEGIQLISVLRSMANAVLIKLKQEKIPVITGGSNNGNEMSTTDTTEVVILLKSLPCNGGQMTEANLPEDLIDPLMSADEMPDNWTLESRPSIDSNTTVYNEELERVPIREGLVETLYQCWLVLLFVLAFYYYNVKWYFMNGVDSNVPFEPISWWMLAKGWQSWSHWS